MENKKSAPSVRPESVSGFNEWMPEQKIIENQIIDLMRKHFELAGFVPLETAAVERNTILQSKGIEGKEIYQLTRFAGSSHESANDRQRDYSLHFDLTVPMSRYVAMHSGKLSFPFKRYQIQKSWRGERPSYARFREFYQCDIDVIGDTTLDHAYDAEVLSVACSIFRELELRYSIKGLVVHVSNRKILEGLLDHFSLPTQDRIDIFKSEYTNILNGNGQHNVIKGGTDLLTKLFSLDEEGRQARMILSWMNDSTLSDTEVLSKFLSFERSRIVKYIDDIEKISRDELLRDLISKVGVPEETAKLILEFMDTVCHISTNAQKIDYMRGFSQNELYQTGVEELSDFISSAEKFGVEADRVLVDPRIARGLSYYTGTIYETILPAAPEIGSVCSGGRYDNLAGEFSKKDLPGVGISFGLTRLLFAAFDKGIIIPPKAANVATVLVAVQDRSVMKNMMGIAASIREAGVNCEIYLNNKSLKSQLKYANTKGFCQIVFGTESEINDGMVNIKDLLSGTQELVSIDRIPSLVTKTSLD